MLLAQYGNHGCELYGFSHDYGKRKPSFCAWVGHQAFAAFFAGKTILESRAGRSDMLR